MAPAPGAPGASAATGGMGGMDMGGDAPLVGLKLEMTPSSFTATTKATMSFSIVGPDGTAITDLKVEQTKLLHLIVVRSDLTGYQHLHPEKNSAGLWSVPVEFAASDLAYTHIHPTSDTQRPKSGTTSSANTRSRPQQQSSQPRRTG